MKAIAILKKGPTMKKKKGMPQKERRKIA